jgi:uncharacterized membrane protein YdjX (TVP38/TMEM64 family)
LAGDDVTTEQQKLGSSEDNKGRGLLRFLPLVLLLAALAAFFGTGLHRKLSFEAFIHYEGRLRQLVGDHGLTMLGLYVLVYVAGVTLSLPVSALFSAIGGYLFGWALGSAAAAVAATTGAVCIFLIARTSLGKPLLRLSGPKIQRLAAGFQKRAFSYLLFLRLLPVMPFWLTNLAAACFGMRLRPFVLATALGMLPVAFAFAFAGSGLDAVIAQEKEKLDACRAAGRPDCGIDFDPGSLLTPKLMIGLGLLGAMALLPIAVRYWKKKRS